MFRATRCHFSDSFVSGARARASQPKREKRSFPSRLFSREKASFFSATAGVGDALEAVGLRARWNAYRDEPELASGYGTGLVVRATATALLRDRSVGVWANGAEPSARGENVPEEDVPAGARADLRARSSRRASAEDARARALDAVLSWALEHRMGVLRAAALLQARRAVARDPDPSGDPVGDGGRLDRAPGRDPLRVAAESSGAVPCFSGRVVAAAASASRGRRASDGGATKRVTAWVARDATGASTEVTLRAMPAGNAEALAARLPGSAVSCVNFLVYAKADARGRLAYALVQRDDDDDDAVKKTAGTADARARTPRAVSELCVLPEGDARAEDVAARTRGTRRASAEAPSLRSLVDFSGARGNSPSNSPPSAETVARRHQGVESGDGVGDAAVVVVRARVAWVRLPRATRASVFPGAGARSAVSVSEKPKKKRKRETRRSPRGVPATRAEVAESLLARGCVLCLRALAPDPADPADCFGGRIIRQCACHSGRADAVGWVWRALELGLADDAELHDASADADDEKASFFSGGKKAFRATKTCDDGRSEAFTKEEGDRGVVEDTDDRANDDRSTDSFSNVRVARVDASLVSRLLLGASASAAAAAAARDAGISDEELATSSSGENVSFEAIMRTRRRTNEKKKADGEIDHLALAVAAINALAAGPARNATPIAWHLRAPPPDPNGVRFADGAPLEVVDFVAAV